MPKFKQRIKEPSTWAGLAGIFQALAFVFPAHAGALHGLTAVAGCIAAQMPEGGGDGRE